MIADTEQTDWNDEELTRGIIRLNGTILGLVLGVLTGLIVFVATIWLVLKGGDQIGPHLSLMGQFFGGYSVSFTGSVVGLLYGATLGFLTGWLIAWLYNVVAFRTR